MAVAPIGWMFSPIKGKIPDPTEQEKLRKAAYLRHIEKLPFREIAIELDAEGFRNRRGNSLTTNNVWRWFKTGAIDNIIT